VDRRVLLVIALLALCPTRVASAADSPSEGDKQRAQQLYDGAMKAFDQDDYDGALRGFQSSYEAVKSPNSHFMIARSLARLGRNVEAYKELTLVIDECDARGERYADTKHAAYAKRQEVTPRIGLLTVTQGNAPKGTHVSLGDEKVAPSDIGKPLPVLPGETKVVALTPDGKTHTQKVTLLAGATADVALDIPNEKKHVEVKEPPFNETDYRTYSAALELHAAGETVPPSDIDSRGAGVGARLYVNILPRGLFPGVVDSFAVGAGADFILTSTRAEEAGGPRKHVLVPVTAQWNLWFVDNFALFFEPGVNMVFGAGTHVQPAIYVGGRYVLGSSVGIVLRAGIPDVTLGLGLLF
jgi:hypothetical protein